MDVLTREDAIKRIRDIRKYKSVDHINNYRNDQYLLGDSERGAINELIAIFDIKDEEI